MYEILLYVNIHKNGEGEKLLREYPTHLILYLRSSVLTKNKINDNDKDKISNTKALSLSQ
jgi:hypothetical protein